MSGVPHVLDVLDDRHEDPRVPLPQEQALDVRDVVILDERLALVVVVRHRDHGHAEVRPLDLVGELGRVEVCGAERRQDQVEARLPARQVEGLGPARDVRQPRGVVQRQLEELAQDQLVEPAVLLERERVVEARDQEDVPHPPGHQVLEPLERAAGVGRGGGVGRHGRVQHTVKRGAAHEPGGRISSIATRRGYAPPSGW